jgi:protein-S-isoprenylcysteine O-methyltransferase Ste14
MLGFAFIHSLFATSIVKDIFRRLLGETFMSVTYRLLYTCLSIVTTIVAALFYMSVPDELIFRGPDWFRWTMQFIRLAAVVFGIMSAKGFSPVEFLGVSQVWRYITKREVSGDTEGIRHTLVTKGVFGIVRHPMYLAGIVIFTFNPDITRNWLTLIVLADAYFVYGALVEEKRLIRRFGQEYIDYMKNVPRFIPRRRRNS